mmetsp:Transcript_28081/g.56914  ORF Transcript_28081/g.56914 Transcript_28081/m.56914 type:complete len:169 (-) Transcript_28081:229-735(-)
MSSSRPLATPSALSSCGIATCARGGRTRGSSAPLQRPMAGVGLHRVAKEDAVLSGTDIPQGSVVLNVCPHIGRVALQDGDEFIPERWEPRHKDYDTVTKYNVMYSQGKRNCVGQNMANMQVLYTLSTLLQHYNFELVSEVRPEMATTFKPCNLQFKITSRGHGMGDAK